MAVVVLARDIFLLYVIVTWQIVRIIFLEKVGLFPRKCDEKEPLALVLLVFSISIHNLIFYTLSAIIGSDMALCKTSSWLKEAK